MRRHICVAGASALGRLGVVLLAVAMLVPGGALGEQASEPGVPVAGQLDVGASFSCAIVSGGQVRCWGYGREGELGYPGVTTVGTTDTPASVGPVDIGAGFTATAISSGDAHTCVIRNDSSVVCWGYGAQGRLGYGNTNNVGDTQTPGSVGPVKLGTGRTAVAIAAGGGHTCAVLDNGSVLCWGFGFDGQLGLGDTNNVGDRTFVTPNISGPVDLGAGRKAVAVTAGTDHTCVILAKASADGGSVMCWGRNVQGQLGYGNTASVGDGATPTSTLVPDLSVAAAGPVKLGAGHTAVAISAGNADTCAILDDGSVRCWGYGLDGQLGYGSTKNTGDTSSDTPDMLPAVNLGPGHTAVAISAGSIHTCAILDNRSVLCWGYGSQGRLGYGNTSSVGDTPSDTPDTVGPVNLGPGRTAVSISAGFAHTCARLDGGDVRCWGYGGNGRLGYCSERNVGDSAADTPDTSGPVNLVPGNGGELCVPAPVNGLLPSIAGQTTVGQVLSEAHGTWSPTPTGYSYQWDRCDSAGATCAAIAGATTQSYLLDPSDVGSTIRVVETASDAGPSTGSATSAQTAVVNAVAVISATDPDTARERGWRSCLAKVTADATHARALTHRGSKRQRARARRRLARQLAGGRRKCVKTYGRTPGPVTGLRAVVRGATKVELDFTAPGTNGNNPPGATGYLVKESLSPIAGAKDFTTAHALCHGACRFAITTIGTEVTLMISGLRAHTIYYFAIAALDNVTARAGPRSPMVKATTT
ncbi:MAG: hypothetical protein M3071_16205 [Actinomycetota bacterium]|nr:hypothetical protein [Actinomycetota bacterium]